MHLGHHPAQWKFFTTITLRKPGKPSYLIRNAYRPIALEDTSSKVMECVVARRLAAGRRAGPSPGQSLWRPSSGDDHRRCATPGTANQSFVAHRERTIVRHPAGGIEVHGAPVKSHGTPPGNHRLLVRLESTFSACEYRMGTERDTGARSKPVQQRLSGNPPANSLASGFPLAGFHSDPQLLE